jgi:hypothetical protein
LALELADFVQCVRTGTTPRSSAELGVDVVRTIEAATGTLRSNAVGAAEATPARR